MESISDLSVALKELLPLVLEISVSEKQCLKSSV
jgi:hypothetical protein